RCLVGPDPGHDQGLREGLDSRPTFEPAREPATAASRPLRRDAGMGPERPGGAMTSRRIMTADEIRRAVIRISHEIVEKQAGTDGLRLVGIQRRGVPLAKRLAAEIEAHEGASIGVGALDIEFYRDDA